MKANSQTKVTNLNADKVDGLESASFVQGGGKASQGIKTMAVGVSQTVLTTSNPNIKLGYECNPETNFLVVTNSGSELLTLFSDNNASNGLDSIGNRELVQNESITDPITDI
jgi:hypothetical protein